MKVSAKISHNTSPSVVGVSLIAGLGLVLMITALAVGATQGVDADTNMIAMLFIGGLLLLIIGVGAWFTITQPHRHFDDINQPAPSDHAHGHDDHALAVHGESGLQSGH